LSWDQNLRRESSKKKKKKNMFFDVFNQYRKSRLISNESDANLTQEVFTKKKFSKSTFHEKKTTSIMKRSYNSNYRRRFSYYKFCKCYFDDWSWCSRQKFLKRFLSTNIILRSFLIDVEICVRITISKRKKKFVVFLVTVISLMSSTFKSWLMRMSSNEKNFAKHFVKIIKTKILINNFIFWEI
jgi:hypothetical protein